jgi:peptide/nickel transport system substrate-binding protein
MPYLLRAHDEHGTRRPRRARLSALLALTTALALAVVGCSATPPVDSPDSIRIGITPDRLAGSYDPRGATTYELSAKGVYETLFTADSGLELGGYEPLLATGYEQSADWKTVTVTLRDGVTFTDGEKLTAQGVKTYLDGMAATEGWWFKSFWDTASPTLTAVDEHTLEFASDSAMPLIGRTFLQVLFNYVPIVSPQVLDDLDAAAEVAVGTGPYIVESFTPEVGVTLTRNEDYWDPSAYPFDSIELTVFADDIAALNALSAGQVDATALSVTLAEQAESQGFTLNEEKYPSNVYGLYVADRNGTVNPAFADQRVRQAMAFAIDREAINEEVDHGRGFVTSQPFIETQAEYVPDGDDRYTYDPDRARELLAEAGYPDGFDVSILSTTFLGADELEPIIAQYLGDVGIRVTFETLPTNEFFAAGGSGTEFPLINFVTSPSGMIPVFISATAVFNPFKIQDPEVDDRWAVIQTGPDAAAAEASAELGEYVVDQSFLTIYRATKAIWGTAPGFVVPFKVGAPELGDFAYDG